MKAITQQAISRDVLRDRYLHGGEQTEDDVLRRVAGALASVEPAAQRAAWEERFLRNLRAGAIGAGRVMSGAGTGLAVTLMNCFVQPVGDCISGQDEGGFAGIYQALGEAAETMRCGGGVGYDFSRLRPRGAEVRSTRSIASGPCSYMDVFDWSCAAIESAGARRGAQMGVLRIDHPDILEFLGAKRTPGRWRTFNVSVAVTDAFMHALQSGGDWHLVHRARPGPALIAQGAHQRGDGLWVYRTLPAVQLWRDLMGSAYDTAEPGLLFLDAINRDNNLRRIEQIAATNVCAEQPLPPYGSCDLGPVILPRFVRHPFGSGGSARFDFDSFAQAVAVQVRALDNVLELTYWPLPQQRDEAMVKRRIGVGFTGLGDALVMLGLRYDAAQGRDMAARVARCLRDSAYRASVELAVERSPFPLFDANAYLEPGTFASRLDPQLQGAIRAHGIRNSHLLSIAPTGSVSLAFADNTSNGIEPPFSWVYTRRKRQTDGSVRQYEVEDHAWRVYRAQDHDTASLPPFFRSAREITPADHVAMLQAVQRFVDAAISKTIHVPGGYPREAFAEVGVGAWRAGLKGLTTWRAGASVGAVLGDAPAATP